MRLSTKWLPIKYTTLTSVCILTACAPHHATIETSLSTTTPPQVESAAQPSVNPETQKSALKAANVSSWELSGAIAAKSQKKGWTASLNWLQQGANHYQIRLFGPLGGGTIVVEKQGGSITYQDGPKKITSTNADQLLHQQTGIQLPVNNLYYWVRGIPAPGGNDSAQYDASNHLTTLQQAGYRIEYANYTSANGLDLPSKIRLQGHGVSIKLIIKHWRV